METRGSGARIRNTRIPVWPIVERVLREGATPRQAVRAWPHVTLAQIYGAIAFHYDHREEIDSHIRRSERALETLTRESRVVRLPSRVATSRANRGRRARR